jgi:hypothetical protein
MYSSDVEMPGSSNLDSEPDTPGQVCIAPNVAAASESYVHSDPTPILDPKAFNPISWSDNAKPTFPSLHLYAFDTLAIPAMYTECERVFSSTKKLTIPERNSLAEEIIEVSECLKN